MINQMLKIPLLLIVLFFVPTANACNEQIILDPISNHPLMQQIGILEYPSSVTYGYGLNSDGSVHRPDCGVFSASTVKIPVLLVDFADYNPEIDSSYFNSNENPIKNYKKFTPTEINELLNNSDGPAQFFDDTSGGNLKLQFQTYGWISSGSTGAYLQNMSAYKIDNGDGTFSCDIDRIFKDALKDAVINYGLDLRNYDNELVSPSDVAVVDGIVLVIEGGIGTCARSSMRWNASGFDTTEHGAVLRQAKLADLLEPSDPNFSKIENSKVLFDKFVILPEQSPLVVEADGWTGQFYRLGTWVHELGHMILGYPDYYFINNNMGNWALSGGALDTPTHPAAFEKWIYGKWITPLVIAQNGVYDVTANEKPDREKYDKNNYLYIYNIEGDPNRYLAIENRWLWKEGNTKTNWAYNPMNDSEAQFFDGGLMITEFDWNVRFNEIQEYSAVYHHTPTNSVRVLYRSGDTFEKCYSSECIKINSIVAPAETASFQFTRTTNNERSIVSFKDRFHYFYNPDLFAVDVPIPLTRLSGQSEIKVQLSSSSPGPNNYNFIFDAYMQNNLVWKSGDQSSTKLLKNTVALGWWANGAKQQVITLELSDKFGTVEFDIGKTDLIFSSVPPSGFDVDGDTVPDELDGLPHDSSDWRDTDGDKIGNYADLDDDGDGIDDLVDPLPLDPINNASSSSSLSSSTSSISSSSASSSSSSISNVGSGAQNNSSGGGGGGYLNLTFLLLVTLLLFNKKIRFFN